MHPLIVGATIVFDLTHMKTRMRTIAMLLISAVAMSLMCGLMPNYAHAAAVDDVAAEIVELYANPTAYEASHRDWVEGVLADYNALSDQDRAALDAREGHPGGTGQSLGRVLEAAVWSVHSYDYIDNWTTLPDGTYDANTTPALLSSYSKGKSTSSRQRPWSVKSVTVSGGYATATITVESDTYTGLWMGGKTYPNTSLSGNSEFEGIPIDLNSTFYFAGISSSMPIPIAFSLTTSIEEPAYVVNHTVTFRDGYTEGDEGILKIEEVEHGQSATAPEPPTRDGFMFDDWDTTEFNNVTKDLTVNATWLEEGVYYTVTFLDRPGGNTISKVKVKEGGSVTPPPNPSRSGYQFVGWNPATFENITSDLEIVAQWMSDDEVSAEAVRKKIEAIPAVESLVGDTDNPIVAEAGKAYIAMTADQRALLDPEEEGLELRLVRALIAVLPGDPFDINLDTQERMTTPIKTAQTAYGLLSEELQAQLDNETPTTASRTYGRYLESAVWALDSLRSINDITILKDGTYSKGFTSSSSRGKNALKHDVTFTVKSVTVKDGHVIATVECSGTSYQTLFIGGKKYENTQTKVGAKPQFEIPLNLNSTVHFSVKSKSATEETEAVAFEMTVSADEGSMTPDPKKEDDSGDDSKGGGSGGGTDGSGSQGGGSPSLGPSSSGGSNAGNLSSLLRTGSTGTGSSSANGALADSEASKSASSKSNNVAGKGGLSTESASANGILPINLAPAIAGGTLFAASLGCLAFALRFVRREELLR